MEPTKDIAGLNGIGTATAAAMIAFLVREGYAVVGEVTSPKRTKAVTLTPLGERVKAEASAVTTASGRAFGQTFGEAKVDERNAAVRVIHGHPALAEGLRPYPGGWQAAKPFAAQTNDLLADPRRALPRYPVVTHRGGYPDGS